MLKHPLFRAAEILDMAIQIEHQGLAFYQACMAAAREQKVREVFEFMIGQEKEHVETFSRMKEGLDEVRLPETYSGETRKYVDSFVKDRVFHEIEKASSDASQAPDPFRAIEFAIEFQQRSVHFYARIKHVVRASESEAVEKIISEEHGHIRCLLALREELES